MQYYIVVYSILDVFNKVIYSQVNLKLLTHFFPQNIVCNIITFIWNTGDEMRAATCALRPASCDMRHATCELRAASCELRHASCDMRAARCDMRGATYRLLNAAYLTPKGN